MPAQNAHSSLPAAATTQDESQILKGCEQAADLLKFERAKSAALQEKIDGLNVQNGLLRDQIALERERGDLYKAAAAERATANGIDDIRVANFERIDRIRVEQISTITADRDRLLAENAKLRNPGFFKTLFDPRALTFGIAGFGIGRATR